MCMMSLFVQAAVAQGMEILGEKKTRQLGSPLMMKNASAALLELQEMVRSGEAPAFDQIDTIKKIIEDDIMPVLSTTRDAAVQATTDHRNAIQLCNDQSKAAEEGHLTVTQASVNTQRSQHEACRVVEKGQYDHNLTDADSSCSKLGKFLHEATPLQFADASPRVTKVQYVIDAGETNMCSSSEVKALDGSCTDDEAELVTTEADCRAKQSSFELGFCTWKTQLEDNCENLETCHSTALTAYNTHVAKTVTLVEKWNVETAALQKILCYCDVWLSEKDTGDTGDDRSKVNATKFAVCNDKVHTPVPVDYGTPAEKVACLLTAVDNHPGTPGFITQEYGSFTDFFEPVVPCMEATTAAPTTLAPTTTQAPGRPYVEKPALNGLCDGDELRGGDGAPNVDACKSQCDMTPACEFLSFCPTGGFRCTGGHNNLCSLHTTCTSTHSGTGGFTTYQHQAALLAERSPAHVADGNANASAQLLELHADGSEPKDKTRKRIVRRVNKQTHLPNTVQVDSQGNMRADNAEAVVKTATEKYSSSELQGMEADGLMSLAKSSGLVNSEVFKANLAKLILNSQDAQ